MEELAVGNPRLLSGLNVTREVLKTSSDINQHQFIDVKGVIPIYIVWGRQ